MKEISWENKKRVMIDTNGLIRYFGIKLRKENPKISNQGKKIIDSGLNEIGYVLFVSAISLIEIWSNLKRDDNDLQSFQNTIKLLYEANIRVVEPTDETLSFYIKLSDFGELKEHDRIIYASAKEWECDIIISSDELIEIYSQHESGPQIISS